jgi:hypothetical protein
MNLIYKLLVGALSIASSSAITLTTALTSKAEARFADFLFCFSAIDALLLFTYWATKRDKPLRRPLPWVFACLLSCILIAGAAVKWVDFRLTTLQHNDTSPVLAEIRKDVAPDDTLRPAGLPTPSLPDGCKPPDDALLVFFGTVVAWATDFPSLVIRTPDTELLSLSANYDGIVIDTLRIFDDRSNIIARIDQNGFWVSSDVRKKRPDKSTLVVFDHLDQEVLRIHLLNSRAVTIGGIFRQSPFKTATIDSIGIHAAGVNWAGSCIGRPNPGFAMILLGR